MVGPEKTPDAQGKSTGRNPRSEPDKVLAFLARLATEFTTVLRLSDLLEHILRVCREEMGFDSCSLALLDGDELVIRAASGLRASYRNMVIPHGKGLHGEVMAMGNPLLIPDMAADPRVYRLEPGIRSGIYAPLAVHGRIIGVLSAHRSTVNAFTEADLNLLAILARYLAGAVEVARLHEQLKELAATDALTGLANRRAFLDRLGTEIARAQRSRSTFSIAILDLDGLKAINDTYGHTIGDGALLAFADTLGRCLRASDLAARFGGDEFTLLLPDTTQRQAEATLDRLGITDISFRDAQGGLVPLRFSWGIAAWPDDGVDSDGLLQTADSRLYAMKQRFLEGESPETGTSPA